MSTPSHTILCVDDEENILSSLKRLLRKEPYRVLTAAGGEQGLEMLRENEVHLVLTDQRMPGMSGTEFLARVKEAYPAVVRVILTGYTDVDSITESINKGHIYKFFLKPWNDQNLKLEIRSALEQYDLVQANQDLHEKVVEQNQQLTRVNEQLEEMVRERTRKLEIQNRALEVSHAVLEGLPVPIIGVSAEGMIVMRNRAARSVGCGVEIGDTVGSCFPREIQEAVERVLQTKDVERLERCALSDRVCLAEVTPLRGGFSGKGVVLSLYSSDQQGGPRHPHGPNALEEAGA